MQFKFKLIAVFVILILLVSGVLVLNYVLTSKPFEPTPTINYNLNEIFTSASFLYGPQGWAPYDTKLPLYPGGNVNTDSYYLLFVDLNATYNTTATYPCVQVDYSFTDLEGIAAFHVYGYNHDNGGIQWRNRVDGVGYLSGWYVQGSASGGTQTTILAQPLEANNNLYIQVANKNGAIYNDFGNNTYYYKFKSGGGLNAMHITVNPNELNGQVTNTGNQTGTFYLTYSGDKMVEDFILLVAVSGPITNSFALNLKTSVPS